MQFPRSRPVSTFHRVAIALFGASLAVLGCTSILGDFTSEGSSADAGGPDASTPDATLPDGATSDAPSNDAPSDASADAMAESSAPDVGTDAPVVCNGAGIACFYSQCEKGALACSADGGLTCTPAGDESNGSPCTDDGGSVCNKGTCVACNAGGSCAGALSCFQATYSCSSGAPVCTDAGPVADGKGCGTNEVCTSGVCSPCQVGNPCAPTNPCDVGKITACGASQTCTDQGTKQADGYPCPSGICVGGACTPCASNGPCDAGLCATGTQSCTTTATCQAATLPDGTSCGPSGSNQVCESSACVTKCDPASCASGCCNGNTCVAYGSQSTTSCGTNAALCAGCATGQDACNAGVCGCSSGETACASGCVNVMGNNPLNCGACQHSCQGGQCVAGVCQALTLSPGTSYAGAGVVVDGTNVYYNVAANIYSCPVGGGCGAGTLVQTLPGVPGGSGDTIRAISLLAPPASSTYGGTLFSLYYADDNADDEQLRFANITKSSKLISTLALSTGTSSSGSVGFDPTNSWIYYIDASVLSRAKPDGSSPSDILSPPQTVVGTSWAPVVDNLGDVYFSFGSTGKGLYYCGATGNCPTPLGNVALTTPVNPQGMYFDGTNVWVADLGTGSGAVGAIYKCAAGTACGAAPPFASGLTSPTSIVSDGKNVYWSSSAGQLLRCPVTGCNGAPTVVVASAPAIASSTSSPIVQDANSVYWADQTGIRKLAKL